MFVLRNWIWEVSWIFKDDPMLYKYTIWWRWWLWWGGDDDTMVTYILWCVCLRHQKSSLPQKLKNNIQSELDETLKTPKNVPAWTVSWTYDPACLGGLGLVSKYILFGWHRQIQSQVANTYWSWWWRSISDTAIGEEPTSKRLVSANHRCRSKSWLLMMEMAKIVEMITMKMRIMLGMELLTKRPTWITSNLRFSQRYRRFNGISQLISWTKAHWKL